MEKLGNKLYWAYFVNFMFLGLISFVGVLGLFEVQFTQAEIRNKIFLGLGGKLDYSERTSLSSKARYYFAKSVALSFYVGAVAVAIVSPAFFFSTIIVTEIFMPMYPVSERNDAVGQASY